MSWTEAPSEAEPITCWSLSVPRVIPIRVVIVHLHILAARIGFADEVTAAKTERRKHSINSYRSRQCAGVRS